jgi:hypothetical protein
MPPVCHFLDIFIDDEPPAYLKDEAAIADWL